MRDGLQLPDPRQRLSGPQARHKGVQEGRQEGHAGGKNEETDQEDNLPRTEGPIQDEKGLCGLRLSHHKFSVCVHTPISDLLTCYERG